MQRQNPERSSNRSLVLNGNSSSCSFPFSFRYETVAEYSTTRAIPYKTPSIFVVMRKSTSRPDLRLSRRSVAPHAAEWAFLNGPGRFLLLRSLRNEEGLHRTARRFTERRLIGGQDRLVEADEDDLLQPRSAGQVLPHRTDRERSGRGDRIPVHPAADRRKRDRPHAVLNRDSRQRVPVARGQQLRLSLTAPLPHRPHGVNHVPRRQTVPPRILASPAGHPPSSGTLRGAPAPPPGGWRRPRRRLRGATRSQR